MSQILRSAVQRLQSYSRELKELDLFVDKPWLQIDSAGAKVLFVFRSVDNQFLLIRNGEVETNKWEYLSYINSLIITWNGGQSLYRQGFVDADFTILKKDGVDEYVMLVDENAVLARTIEEATKTLLLRYENAANGAHAVDDDQLIPAEVWAKRTGTRFRHIVNAIQLGQINGIHRNGKWYVVK